LANINLLPGLEKRAANYVPLTPLDFLRRAGEVYPEKTGIVHGIRRQSWAATYRRARAFASSASTHSFAPFRGESESE
jgi:fatty-acyl-CoA synthase